VVDREAVAEMVRNIKKQALEERDMLINALHQIQNRFGNYIPVEAAKVVAEELNVAESKVYEVLTFYTMFSTKPRGKYVIRVCVNLPCHVTGGRQIVEALKEVLGVDFDQTTKDGLFTLERTSCLGLCGVAPVIMVNDEYYGDLTPKKVKEIIENLRARGDAK
jgi:NADH-quinone oxidoreductase subunit E